MAKKAFSFDNGEGSGFVEFEYTPSQKEKLDRHNLAMNQWDMWLINGTAIPTMKEFYEMDNETAKNLSLFDEIYKHYKKYGEKVIETMDNITGGEKDLLDEIMEAVERVIRYNHIDEMSFETVGDMLVTTQQFYIDMEKLETLYDELKNNTGSE